jgi:hypothetical protein
MSARTNEPAVWRARESWKRVCDRRARVAAGERQAVAQPQHVQLGSQTGHQLVSTVAAVI